MTIEQQIMLDELVKLLNYHNITDQELEQLVVVTLGKFSGYDSKFAVLLAGTLITGLLRMLQKQNSNEISIKE